MNSTLRNILGLTPLLLLFILGACRNTDGGGDAGPGTSGIESAAPGSGNTREVEITREQFETSGMRIGEPESFTFMLSTSARAYVMAAPAGQVRISTLIPGQVRKLPVSTGTLVRKGDILFTLEGREIILLQQEYASAVHELRSVRATFENQKTLSKEDFTSRRALIDAESAYMSLVSRVEGLKAQLELLHLDPASAEKGTFYTEIPVLSPIRGYVTGMDLVLGQYIDPAETVLEIVDTDQLQLQVHIYEKDLKDLEAGQAVRFYPPDAPEHIYQASLTHVGRSVDPGSKTVLCLARILPGDRADFVHRQYVECSVITCEREAPAIPDDALIEEEGKYYVLSLEREEPSRLVFRRVPAEVGVIQQDHAEITGGNLRGILLKGVYDLSSAE